LRYLDWVYHVFQTGRGDALSLYDSSVSPPDALLAEAARKVFGDAGGVGILSAFGGGSVALRKYLADCYRISPARVVATSGAASGLALIYRALAQAGDHVLVERPGYQPFEDMALAAGLQVEGFARAEGDARPVLEDIRARLRPETRLIVLSHLHNPTGQPLAERDLSALVTLCESRGLLLVVDEIYGAFAGDASLAALRSPMVISVSGLSKIFGLGALRCGWIVAASDLAETLRRASVHGDPGVSAVSHAIALEVLRAWPAFRAHTEAVVAPNRVLIAAWLDRMAGEGLVECRLSPLGCLAFPRLVGMARTDGFAAWLYATKGIIVAPGQFWGAARHVRLGFGMERARLEAGLAGLGDALRAYAAMPFGARQAVDDYRWL